MKSQKKTLKLGQMQMLVCNALSLVKQNSIEYN